MENKIIVALVLVVITTMCPCQGAVPPEKFSIVIENSHQPRLYLDGFTCFIGTIDAAGIARVPTRYAMAPRKGFMDSVRGEQRVQNPVFWGTDAMKLSFDSIATPEILMVGHKSKDEKEWTVVLLDVTALQKDANGNYKLNIATIETAKSAMPADSERIFAALETAKREFERLSDSEP